MTLPFIQLGLLPFLRLVTTIVGTGWMSSPMSWSSDGEWLSYTIVSDADQTEFRPGWLFVTSTGPGAPTGQLAQAQQGVAAPAPVYRIWATRRDHHSSVLIEESHFPLTAPAWSPRGKSVAFGRFVPQSMEPAQINQRGRYEVVIQDGLDRKQVVWSTTEFELNPAERVAIPQLSCSWSPDGIYLAVPRPGENRYVDIVRTDHKQRVATLDHASLPAWSPDGSKCAFVRHENNSNRLVYVERRGQVFGDPRPVAVLGPIPAPPYWYSDSRSIYAVVEKASNRSHELEIVRFVLEPTESIRVLNLVPTEPARRAAKIRGLAIDFDREAERCFFALDLEGRDSAVVWCLPRDRERTHKRFHPLDRSQRITDVSLSPDGQLVAMRIGTPRGLTPPIIYDTETEQTTLLVADEETRKAWLEELAEVARRILVGSLPPAMVDGQLADRPTLLPLPGELPAHDETIVRLNRLARFGSALASVPSSGPPLAKRQGPRSFESEASLFFDYLRGDYLAASVDLDNLEPLLSSPEERLSLLSLRGQLFWARGERTEAKAVIDYLVSCGDPNRRLVEDTPLGLVFSPFISPQQLWAHYLTALAAHGIEPKSPPDSELPGDVFDPRLQIPAGGPIAPIIERAGGPIPFAPVAPGREIP